MSRLLDIEITSTLSAPREEVWRSVSTMKGVNFELRPFVHMTSPAEHQVLPSTPEPGQVVFKSWLLLFGVMPFDRHSLAFDEVDEVDEGYCFSEVSTSWLQREWRHERVVGDGPGTGCSVTDRLVISPRVALAKPIVVAIVSKLFEHRHRRLAARFGTEPNV